jgi:hypothetical protein
VIEDDRQGRRDVGPEEVERREGHRVGEDPDDRGGDLDAPGAFSLAVTVPAISSTVSSCSFATIAMKSASSLTTWVSPTDRG